MAVSLAYSIDMSGWTEPMRRMAAKARDLSDAHREIGELVLRRVRENFQSSGGHEKWAPLAESTLIARARGRTGGGKVYDRRYKKKTLTKRAMTIMANAKPLIFTARLLRSMTYVAVRDYVDIGTRIAYARRLFFGWNGHGPKTPARNPFGLAPGDQGQILAIYQRHIMGGR